jgi:hypothetical protein
MNDNWWTMKKMIEAREHDLRVRMEQVKPWLSRESGEKSRPRARWELGEVVREWLGL